MQAVEQLAFADKVLLNKIDLVSEEEKKEVIKRIKVRHRKCQPAHRLRRTPTSKQVLSRFIARQCRGCHPDAAWTWSTLQSYAGAEQLLLH